MFSSPAKPSAPTYHFTRLICEDAFQSEVHYDDKDLRYVDVTLKDGCFSGYVGLPNKWQDFQAQMMGNDPADWMSAWYSGWSDPEGPYSSAYVNTQRIYANRKVPSMSVRLQGHGTVRFYCVTGCPPPGK